MTLPNPVGSDSKMTTLRDIYLMHFNNHVHNPAISIQCLKTIFSDLRINVDEKNMDQGLIQEFLNICKSWFAVVPHEKLIYANFFKHLSLKLRSLESYTPSENNLEIDKSIRKKTIKIEAIDASKVGTGRYVLNVDCKLSQINTMKIDYSSLPLITISLDAPKKWMHPPLGIKQLLNWPYIGFILHLPDVSIAHYTTHSYSRYISLGNCKEELSFENEDCLELTQGYNIKTEAQFNVETLTMYLCLCMQLTRTLKEVPERKKEELSTIIEILIKGLTRCKSKMCGINVDCSYVGTKNKFTREYDITQNSVHNNSKKKTKTSEGSEYNEPVDKLVEVMTPMFKFNITRCIFRMECSASERERIHLYFQDLIMRKDEKKLEKFIQQINKDISYLCAYCNAMYSESSFSNMEKHILEMHGHEEPWKCLCCNEMFDAYEMASHSWRHECK